jgi:histidyl-tRNA synthetase
MPGFVQAIDVYCVIGGENERRVAFAHIQALRAAGFRVEYPLKDVGFGKQFKLAADAGARLTLIYGADEIAKNVVKLRDMSTRSEFEVPSAQILETVRDFFSAAP